MQMLQRNFTLGAAVGDKVQQITNYWTSTKFQLKQANSCLKTEQMFSICCLAAIGPMLDKGKRSLICFESYKREELQTIFEWQHNTHPENH